MLRQCWEPMLQELVLGQRVVIDLTKTDWPWQQLVAGASEKVRPQLVGPGIVQFLIEMWGEILCPYSWNVRTKKPVPQPNFVAVRTDGLRVLHHPHKSKDEPEGSPRWLPPIPLRRAGLRGHRSELAIALRPVSRARDGFWNDKAIVLATNCFLS